MNLQIYTLLAICNILRLALCNNKIEDHDVVIVGAGMAGLGIVKINFCILTFLLIGLARLGMTIRMLLTPIVSALFFTAFS